MNVRRLYNLEKCEGHTFRFTYIDEFSSKLNVLSFFSSFPKHQIKSVNTYLIKMNKTFEDIINDLQKDNNLRTFNYDLVLDYMIKNKIPQHLQ